MGNGALTCEQTALISREMQEKFKSFKEKGDSDLVIQAELTAAYNLAVKKYAPSILPKVAAAIPNAEKKSNAAAGSKGGTTTEQNSMRSITKREPPSRENSISMRNNTSTRKASTRRRSFDSQPQPRTSGRIAAGGNRSDKIVQSSSASALNTKKKTNGDSTPADGTLNETPEGSAAIGGAADAQVGVDSWDSVSQQPYCNVCQMGFKSSAFLQRHVKHSDFHSRNVKRKEEEEAKGKSGASSETSETAAVAPTAPSAPVASPLKSGSGSSKIDITNKALPIPANNDGGDGRILSSKQVEGIHYKLLYNGAKLFWKTQQTLDFNIYHHILPDAVEVISFDVRKNKEMNRLYLSYMMIADIVNLTIKEVVAEKLKEIAESESAKLNKFHKAPDPAVLEEDLRRKGVITYVLQRLHPVDQDRGTTIEFLKLFSDDDDHIVQLHGGAPPALVPVKIARRRQTNSEEIEATISSISNDSAAIHASVLRANSLHKESSKRLSGETSEKAAQTIANLVLSIALYLSDKKWWSDFSPMRIRWIKAIQLVIRRKRVRKMKELLISLGKEEYIANPNRRGSETMNTLHAAFTGSPTTSRKSVRRQSFTPSLESIKQMK